MLSERPTFYGSSWVPVPYVAEDIRVPFRISEGFGNKTIYAILKNDLGNSRIWYTGVKYVDPPVLKTFDIAGGSNVTTNREVELSFTRMGGYPDVYYVSENPDNMYGYVRGFVPNPQFILSEGFGTKTLYFMLENEDGRSVILTDTINYAPTNPPSLDSLALNGGAASTTSRTVTLSHTHGGVTPSEYIASENSDFSGAVWQSYISNPVYELSGGSGTKTVYMKLQNSDGESAVQSDTIVYEAPPDPPLLEILFINLDSDSTTSQTITLYHQKSGGVPTHYIASESQDFSGATWQNYTTGPSFTLSAGYGTKTVYMKLRNADGESLTRSDMIEYQSPPNPPILVALNLNNGAETVTIRVVALNHTRQGGTPAHYIASEDPSFADTVWQTYSGNSAFGLSQGSGTKTVYFRLKNEDGISEIRSDTIFYQAPVEPPTLSSLSLDSGAVSTISQMVTLNHIKGGGEPTHYRASENPSFSGANWLPYEGVPTFTLSNVYGVKPVYLQLQNLGGNSVILSDTINYELAPPVMGTLRVNNGATWTTSRNVTLEHTYSDGTPTYYIASERADFSDASWQSYTTVPTFTLSSGYGIKKIWFGLWNSGGVTYAVSDSIELVKPDDHGGTLDSASLIGANSVTIGELEIGGDEDFFKIQIAEEGMLVLDAIPYDGTNGTAVEGVNGILYDSDGRSLTPGGQPGWQTSYHEYKVLSPGTYYVRMSGYYWGVSGQYELKSKFIPGSPFEGWASFSELSGNDMAMDADPNDDGINNLFAYALKVHPINGLSSNESNPMPKYERGNEGITLCFSMPARPPEDIRYVIEQSCDLNTWTRIAETDYGKIWRAGTSPVTSNYNEDSYGRMKITIPSTEKYPTTPNCFLRLKVEVKP